MSSWGELDEATLEIPIKKERPELLLVVLECACWASAAALASFAFGLHARWPLTIAAIPLVFFLATGLLPLARIRRSLGARQSSTPFLFGLTRSTRFSEERQERDTRWTRNALLSIAAIGVAGLVAISWSQGQWTWSSWAVLGNGLLIAGAASLVGAIGGFLFGIPRTFQSDATQSSSVKETEPQRSLERSPEAQTRYLVNTNLEEISDWLTKIIVGIGLVELRRVPELLDRLGNSMLAGLSASSGEMTRSVPLTKSVLLATVIFFLATGFLAGYLMTRLFLALAFRNADEGLQSLARAVTPALAEADLQQPLRAKVEARAVVAKAVTRAPIERLLKRVEEQRLDPASMDADQAEAVANSYYHRDEYSRAIPFFLRVHAARPADAYTTLKLALSLGESGRRNEALELLEEVSRLPQPPDETFKLLGYFLLWSEHRLEESIRRSLQYLSRAPSDSGAILNLACAYGQLFAQEHQIGTEESKRKAEEYRQLALQRLGEAIHASPRMKARAVQLQSDDFRALASDPDFQRLIA